jgi:parvulin-like peptidyl-prolyl isomerase
LAQDEIRKQVAENVDRELLFAAADRLLDDKDKKQAELYAEGWRQQQIILAGGSIETARRRYAAHGRDFDREIKEEYRRRLIQQLFWKKVFPQIQLNADEMRKYYDDNIEKEFTVRDAAQFEMIQIDPAKVGGREVAKQKIEDLRSRAKNGEDFTALAKFSNVKPLRNSEGELPWWDRGAFALSAVEDAAWKLQSGEVSDVIEDGGRLYVVKLEQKRLGRIKPFDEEATQDQIRQELTAQKFRPREKEMLDRLRKESIVRTEPEMLQSALDIAMQCYPQWKGQ